MTPNENPNNASVDAQTPGYPPQTPTPPNAPYGPSPEPKLGERLNVQALVNFVKRPPVLVALLVVGAFCLGRCNGGDKNEVAQTESAVQTESVATAEPDYEKPATNATFLDEFNDVFHRFNERVLKKVNKDSAFVKALKAEFGLTARSALEKSQDYNGPVGEMLKLKDDPIQVELSSFYVMANLNQDFIIDDVSTRVIVRDELRVVLDELRDLDASSLSPALQESFQECIKALAQFLDFDPTNEVVWAAFVHLDLIPIFRNFAKLAREKIPDAYAATLAQPRSITF